MVGRKREDLIYLSIGRRITHACHFKISLPHINRSDSVGRPHRQCPVMRKSMIYEEIIIHNNSAGKVLFARPSVPSRPPRHSTSISQNCKKGNCTPNTHLRCGNRIE